MRGVLVLIVLIAAAFAAHASTIHELRFSQAAKVLVWQDDILVGQGDRIVLSDQSPVAAPDFPGSGVLVPTGGNELPFEQRMRFRVASNSGFTVRLADPADPIQISVNVIALGENAAPLRSRSRQTDGILFQQSFKTAARPGSPESQSIVFEAEWDGDAAPILEIVTLAP